MNGKIHIQELDKIAIFVTLLFFIYLFRPKRRRAERIHNQNQHLNKPPSGLGVLLAKCIILTIMFVAVNTLFEYSENITAYENEKCNQQKYSHKYRCTFEEFTSDDLAKQIDGFLMNSEVGMGFEIGEQLNHGNSPNGPWFWLYYLLGGVVVMSGFRLANKRRTQHLQNLRKVEDNLRPIIRQLANDPRGVIEGRITMPSPVTASKSSRKEERRIFVIFFFSALITIITMMSIFDFFHQINYNFSMSIKHINEALLVGLMAI